jgi:pSer/pThr/pTyr-binding forkhead associated (FHA) protein
VPRLVIFRDGIAIRQVALNGDDLRIGRAEENDLVLPDNERRVSRFHAELRYQNGRPVLIDLNSANGIWVGDRQVQQVPLEPGTVVEIGDYRLLFEGAAQPSAAPETQAGTDARTDSTGRKSGDTLLLGASWPTLDPGRATRPSSPVPKPEQGGLASARRTPSRSKPLVIGVLALIVVAIVVVPKLLLRTGLIRFESTNLIDHPQPTASGASQSTSPQSGAGAALPGSPQPPLAQTVVPTPAVVPTPGNPNPSRGMERRPSPGARTSAATGAEPSVPPGSPARRPDESLPDYLLRVQRLLAVYGEAKAALQAQDFGRAIQTFDRLDKEQPGYLDVQARLAEARSGFAESQRVAAQSAMANAVAAEKRGDLVEAQRLYERALEGDPVSGADEALRRVRVQMKTHGDAAFRRARTFDAMSRTEDAIAQYERAVQLLPPDDPNRKTAKDRLDVLRMNYIK